MYISNLDDEMLRYIPTRDDLWTLAFPLFGGQSFEKLVFSAFLGFLFPGPNLYDFKFKFFSQDS